MRKSDAGDDMKRNWKFKVAKMVIVFAGFVLLAGVAVMLLWNALIPGIFGVAPITWVQALGLLILARILVGGRGHGSWGRHKGGFWRARWDSKMAAMSPEERKKWKDEWGRHGCWDETAEEQSGHPVETKAEA
jgi:hypothetical protein